MDPKNKSFDKIDSRKPVDDGLKRPRLFSQVVAEKKAKESLKNFPKDSSKDEPLYKKKERSIHYSVKDGLFTSIKAGLTDNFVMPFAIAMNASSGMLAVLSSVPQLIASFMQLFSQSSLRFFKTRSRLIFLTALIQSFMWLPLLLIPIFVHDNVPLAFTLILIFVTLETTIGTFQGPIYNSILGDIIDDNKRGEFFGKRNRIVNLMGFLSTLIAGLLLSWFKGFDTNGTAHYVFFGFGILFFLAFVSRATSSYFKSKIYDPPYEVPKNETITFKNFLKNMTHNNYGIFVLYIFMFKLVANISAPFFALYLLRDMQMSYLYYTMIIGSSIIASFLTMGVWGKIIDRRGSKHILAISGFLIPLSPLLLILAMYIPNPHTRFIYILVEEAFSGAVWAAFNLSTSSFLFDATAKDERVKYISYYNFLTGIAVFLGAILGGVLILVYPTWVASAVSFSAIPFIFLTTGILRFLVTAMLIKRVKEAKMVEIDFSGRGFFHRVITVNPHSHTHLEIMSAYKRPSEGALFHSLIPSRSDSGQTMKNPKGELKKSESRKSDFKTEKEFYEHRSFEYYKDNALKTLSKESLNKESSKDKKKVSENLKSEQPKKR